jgi:multiple sugar transport system substrate-binding protein
MYNRSKGGFNTKNDTRLNIRRYRMKVKVIVLLMAALALAGCQGKKEGGAAKSSVTLKVGIWDTNQEPGITAVLQDFIAETGIKAEVEVTPWNEYWTLLEAAATGGTLPDVFWMHSNNSQRFGTSGLLMDLTDRIAKSTAADLSNFPEDLVNLYVFGGRNYAIPKDLDTIALWYNKELFDQAGLAYPSDSWTWDDLRNAARKLSDPAKKRFGIDFRPGEPQTEWSNEVYQNGGYIISADKKKSGFDDPATIAAFEYMVGFVKEGIAPPVSYYESGLDALMQSETIAMGQFGSWVLSSLYANDFFRQKCDIAILPKPASGKRATIYNGLGWVAAANTKNPEEAWKLLEFFSRGDTQRKLSERGVAISAYKGMATPFANGFPEWNVKAYLDQIPDAVMRPYSKNTTAWEEMAIQTLNDAWNGSRPVAAVCREIAQKMNAILATE